MWPRILTHNPPKANAFQYPKAKTEFSLDCPPLGEMIFSPLENIQSWNLGAGTKGGLICKRLINQMKGNRYRKRASEAPE